MCFAVKYTNKNKEQKTVYVGIDTLVPVVKSDNEIELVRWGRTKAESGKSFKHHCARMESIEAGKWSWLQPKAVSIAIDEYADYGKDNEVHWHKLKAGEFLRGALIQDEGTLRVYVVTEPALPEVLEMYKGGRSPRVVQA